MNTHSFRAMDTEWWIGCDTPHLLPGAERLVRQLEARLSRFRRHSALSRLNRERVAVDGVLAAVVRAALRFRTLTGGAFDPTLGAQLAAFGYDRTFAAVGRPGASLPPIRQRPAVGGLRIAVRGNHVALEGSGALDLGGIAKGWTVDCVSEWLMARGGHNILVDGGGDLRGLGGPWDIGVGDDLVVSVRGAGVATSSTLRRRWQTADGSVRHHLIDPHTGAPANGPLDTATVVARDAVTADVLATAVVIDPEGVLPRLPALGARAAVRGRDGRWWTTADWATPLQGERSSSGAAGAAPTSWEND
jgi:thiamine biosynthesis lipoprotein